MKFYKNEKELTKIFYSSAENINRTHPLEYVPIKKESIFKQRVKSIISPIQKKYEKICNFFVSKKEKSFYSKNGFHSQRAIKEYLNYYQDLYFARYPDLEQLKKLLKRNGSPDIANPYKLGNENFFKYNEYGLMAAEVEIILNYIIRNMSEISPAEDEKIEDDKKILSDILLHFEKKKQKEKQDRVIFYKKAMQAWALIALYGNGCEYLKGNIDKDNISVVTIETILNVDYNDIKESIVDIVNAFIKYEYIDSETGLSLLSQRIEMEK